MTNSYVGSYVLADGAAPEHRGLELASDHDDTFKLIVESGWANESSGNVESPSDYFWLVEASSLDDTAWSDMLSHVKSELENYGQTFITPEPGWYVCTRNNDGIFFVYKFDTEPFAREYYAFLEVGDTPADGFASFTPGGTGH